MRSLAVVALLCSAVVCASALAADPELTPDGLQKIEGSRVMLAYARPNAVWSKYKTVQVLPLIIPSVVTGPMPSNEWYEVWYAEEAGVRAEDAAHLQQFYADTFRAELQKSGYTVVEAPRGDTLVIASELTDIIANPSGPVGPSGSVAIRVTMSDGATRAAVSALFDRRFAHYLNRVNTRETDLQQVRDAFANWTHVIAQELREQADKPKVDLWACLNDRKSCPPNVLMPSD